MKKTLILFMLLSCLFVQADSANGKALGLTVRDGEFFKDGKPFRGVGMNYFSAFIRKLGLEGEDADLSDMTYQAGFKTLRKYDIPFVRICASGFWPREWKPYFEEKEAYFATFDQLVKDAEECGLGLIPVLFWCHSTVPDLVGESLNQWGNTDSKTHEFMRQHTLEFVSRYKDSPAIWAWECGNEWINIADLPGKDGGLGFVVPEYGTPAKRTSADKAYRKDIHVAYQAFADTVRTLDSSRAIFSGDTIPRTAAFNNHTNGTWRHDSKEEWSEIFQKDNAPMSALTGHFYYYAKDEEHKESGFVGYGPEEQISFMMDIALKENKPLWIGEFGPAAVEKSREKEREQFEAALDIVIKEKVHLSALWNFDFEHVDQVIWNITETNHRAYMLKAVQEANKKIQSYNN